MAAVGQSCRPKGELLFELLFEWGSGEGEVDVFENNTVLNQA